MSDDIFPVPVRGDVVWLNWKRLKPLMRDPKRLGVVMEEILRSHSDGILRNGPLVRIDPPDDEEATDGR